MSLRQNSRLRRPRRHGAAHGASNLVERSSSACRASTMRQRSARGACRATGGHGAATRSGEAASGRGRAGADGGQRRAGARRAVRRPGRSMRCAPGALVMLMATCPPARCQAIAAEVVAGGPRASSMRRSRAASSARRRRRSPSWSARRQARFETAKPVLDALGDKVFHVGEKPGQGATVKTVNQLLCGVHIAAAAEALSLAEKAGIDGRAAARRSSAARRRRAGCSTIAGRACSRTTRSSPARSIFSSRTSASCSMPGARRKVATAAGGARAPDVPRRLRPRASGAQG